VDRFDQPVTSRDDPTIAPAVPCPGTGCDDQWMNEVPGPDVVAGVAELRAEGFEPIEEHTGALWVADVWPDDDKRSVPETRPYWLANETQTHDRVWLLRSPWPTLTVREVFAVLWTWIERDHRPIDGLTVSAGVAEVLAWDETRARAWLQQLPPGQDDEQDGTD
jgi:hypothetical protein